MKASWRGHKDIAILLLSKGANVNDTDNNGSTAFVFSNEEFYSLLKICGAGNTDTEKKDWTSLMWAASNDNNICRLLIIAGYYVTYSLRGRFKILDEYISWREAVCNIAIMGKGLPEEVSSRISEHLDHSDIFDLSVTNRAAKTASVAPSK